VRSVVRPTRPAPPRCGRDREAERLVDQEEGEPGPAERPALEAGAQGRAEHHVAEVEHQSGEQQRQRGGAHAEQGHHCELERAGIDDDRGEEGQRHAEMPRAAAP